MEAILVSFLLTLCVLTLKLNLPEPEGKELIRKHRHRWDNTNNLVKIRSKMR